MADSKITALTALTAADPINDMLPIVDVSDTTMAASGTTKKISVNNILSSSPTASGALTVTGLVTAGSATITGDLTVDTSTLKVDSTNDRVGFGTASPAQFVHLSKSNTSTALTSPPVGGASLRIQNSSSTNNNFGSVEFYNAAGLFGASVNCQYTNQATPTNDLVFVTRGSSGGVEQMRIASTGDVSVQTGNVVMATSGKGIDFSAKTPDGSGTVGSEVLNDYEEGTWTGTLNGTVADPTIPVTVTGRYTKIGRVVNVSAFFSSVITTGASGRIQITGLPFTNNSSIVTVGTAAFNNMATFTGSPFSSLAASATTIVMFSSNSAANYTAVLFNAGITQDLWVSLNYTVA